jgi:plastocyanin
MSNNTIFSYTFLSAGTYPYHCSIHTNMTGTVVVN